MSIFKALCKDCGSENVLITLGSSAPKGKSVGSGMMIMPFGKHQGESIDDIAMDDPDYLEWCLENMDNLSPRLRDAIEDALG